ncbi:hypothetical protein MBCUR_17300 [Methanobrevibacter curvatus]|uniref:Uncharacterized protein n=1 Tax=Methanobrevibacter curvatus TaxID=49547 RepID=A0A165ZE99_9EURY|nr:hypothetical protein MBCUR_17300 [Methanobrevibacter curvatus]
MALTKINLVSKTSVIFTLVAVSGPKLVTLIVYSTKAPFKTTPDTLTVLTTVKLIAGRTLIVSMLLILSPMLEIFVLLMVTLFSMYPVPMAFTIKEIIYDSPGAKLVIVQLIV